MDLQKVDWPTAINLVIAVLTLTYVILLYYTYKQQSRIHSLAAAFDHIAKGEDLIGEHPELIALHNIDPEELTECSVSPVEFVYLIHSFSGGDLFHRIEGGGKAMLTNYRRNMLANERVQKAWIKLIRFRFISDGPFLRAVDSYLREQGIKLPRA